VLLRRHGLRALPGALLLVVGAVPFVQGHVYWPQGGSGLVAIAVGCAVLAAARGAAPAEAVEEPVAR
jgi:hypothetical protein